MPHRPQSAHSGRKTSIKRLEDVDEQEEQKAMQRRLRKRLLAPRSIQLDRKRTVGAVNGLVQVTRDRKEVASSHPTDKMTPVDFFKRKYADKHGVLEYVLKVIRNGMAVRRSEMPKTRGTLKPLASDESEVLYLVYQPHPPCGFQNVYWLMFTDEATLFDAKVDYFTLSVYGFTHVKGLSVVEFVTVQDWMEEKRAFDHLTSMDGLQRIEKMLFFFRWRKRSVKRRHRRVKTLLSAQLFHCHTAAARILLKMRQYCLEILEAETPLSKVMPSTTYTEEAFESLFRRHVLKAQAYINQKIGIISSIILTKTKHLYVCGRVRRDSLANSITSTALDRGVLREKMFHLIRLADFMIVEAVGGHLRRTVRALRDLLCGSLNMHPNQLQLLLNVGKQFRVGMAASTYQTTVIGTIDGEILPAKNSSMTFTPRYHLDTYSRPFPSLYALLHGNYGVQDTSSAISMQIQPAKAEFYRVLHRLLFEYFVYIDKIPRLVGDERFFHVPTPFVPNDRPMFLSGVNPPSKISLGHCQAYLSEIRSALDAYTNQIQHWIQEHVRWIESIKGEEQVYQSCMTASDSPYEGKISAIEYERSQDRWNEFRQYARNMPIAVQIGCFLIDQQELKHYMEEHTSSRISELDRTLPVVYRQVLEELVEEVEVSVPRITSIPYTMEEACTWLSDVSRYLPIKTFRQNFNARCANLTKLKALLAEQGISSEIVGGKEWHKIHALELRWEFGYDTLMTCLMKVQVCDGEHRKSIRAMMKSAAELVNDKIHTLRGVFDHLPMEYLGTKREMERTENEMDAVVQQLEDVVETDIQRRALVHEYAVYETEYRASRLPLEEQESVMEPESAVKIKLAPLQSEALLQYVVVALEIRRWYLAWQKAWVKWMQTPLLHVSGNLVLNRISQFKRRLLHSARTLSRLRRQYDKFDQHEPSLGPQDKAFVRVFWENLKSATRDCNVFQVISTRVFTNERWNLVEAWYNSAMREDVDVFDKETITLEKLKSRWKGDMSPRLQEFMELCEQCAIENSILYRVECESKRVEILEVRLRKVGYCIDFINLTDILLSLEDALLEIQIRHQKMNPWFQDIQIHLNNVLLKKGLCERLHYFQSRFGVWREAVRSHDLDHYFTQLAKHRDVDERTLIWRNFINTVECWNACVRRTYCTKEGMTSLNERRPSKRITLRRKATSVRPVHTAMSADSCITTEFEVLHDVFKDFAFDEHIKWGEAGIHLISEYFSLLRQKVPRLYCLKDEDVMKLMCYEDARDLRSSLQRCYPQVPIIETELAKQSSSQDLMADEDNESKSYSIQLTGIKINSEAKILFDTPVFKVGRIEFWMTRLKEEMTAIHERSLIKAVASSYENAKDLSSNTDILPPCHYLALLLHQSEAISTLLSVSSTDPQACAIDLQKAVAVQHEQIIQLQASILPETSIVINNLILIRFFIIQVLRELLHLISSNGVADAHTYWSMQLKVGRKSTNMYGNSGELPPSDEAMYRYFFQMQDIQLAIGNECVGAIRLPVILPFTSRCMFALFRAMKAQSFACVIPSTSSDDNENPMDMPNALHHFLMQPSWSFNCTLSKEAPLDTIQRLLQAALALKGTITIEHMASLPPSSITAVYQIIRELHSSTAARTTSTIGDRLDIASRAAVYMAGNLTSLDKPLQHPEIFDQIPVIHPTKRSIVEVMTAMYEFELEEDLLEKVTIAFNDIFVVDKEITKQNVPASQIIRQTMEEMARQRRRCYVVLSKYGPPIQREVRCGRVSVPLPKCLDLGETNDSRGIKKLIVDGITWVYTLRSAQYPNNGLQSRIRQILIHHFPDVEDYLLLCKPNFAGSEDETISDAVQMALYRLFHHLNDAQLHTTMDIWWATKSQNAVIVSGDACSGKSSCIQALHKAVSALKMAENEDDTSLSEKSSKVDSRSLGSADLVVVNLSLVSFDELYGPLVSTRSTESTNEGLLTRLLFASLASEEAKVEPLEQWVSFEGEITGQILEPLRVYMENNTYPWLHLYNGQSLEVSRELASKTKFFFEVTDLQHFSPSLLGMCCVIHVPRSCVAPEHLITTWEKVWLLKLSCTSTGDIHDNVAVVLSLTRSLLLHVCIPFVRTFNAELKDSYELAGSMQETTRTSTEEPTKGEYLDGLSVHHLTLSTLKLVESFCLSNRLMLTDMEDIQLIQMICFAVLWGFGSGSGSNVRSQLEQYCHGVAQTSDELHLIARLQGNFMDSAVISNLWDLQSPLDENGGETDMSRCEMVTIDGENTFLTPQMSTIRLIGSYLLRQGSSFLLDGSTGAGKSTLLRVMMSDHKKQFAGDALVHLKLTNSLSSNVIDCTNFPLSWFRPFAQVNDNRGWKTKTEESLVRMSSAKQCIFIDDLSTSRSAKDDSQREYIRSILDHQKVFNHQTNNMQNCRKSCAASMREAFKLPHEQNIQRLLRHFVILRMLPLDRNDLLNVFRWKYHFYFSPSMSDTLHGKSVIDSYSEKVASRARSTVSNSEILLRASVDFSLAVKNMEGVVPATGNRIQFSLHELDKVLGRTLVHAKKLEGGTQVSTIHSSSYLLLLSRLHQSWLSEVRSASLLNYTSFEMSSADSVAEDINLNEGDRTFVKTKVLETLSILSEKYFSAPLQDQAQWPSSPEIVHLMLELLQTLPNMDKDGYGNDEETLQDALARHVRALATGSRKRRNAISTMPSNTVLNLARRLMLKRWTTTIKISTKTTMGSWLRPELKLKLLIGSPSQLNMILHISHAISCHQHLKLYNSNQLPFCMDVVRFACQIANFDDIVWENQGDDVLEQIRQISRSALARNKYTMIIINAEYLCDVLEDFMQEMESGKLPFILSCDPTFLHELCALCVEDQEDLRANTMDEILRLLHIRVQRIIRICLVYDEKSGASEDSIKTTGKMVTVLKMDMNSQSQQIYMDMAHVACSLGHTRISSKTKPL